MPNIPGMIVVDGMAGDRSNLTLWGNAGALINAVVAVNNNAVVIVHAVGPAIVEPWIENPNVTAMLWAGLPGQESRNALMDVLYGASRTVTLALSRYDLSVWDSGAQGWRKPKGTFTFSVGARSRDFPLNGTVPL